MADPTNPYEMDRTQQLAMLLMSLGGGISQASQNGQTGWAGVAPGVANFAGQLGQMQIMGMQRQERQEAMDIRRQQFALQKSEFDDKHAERQARIKGMGAWATANDPGTATASVPGMGPPPVQPRMGPQSYDARTAGLEGGTKNGGMVYNELGSGAGGPYQIMPGTWADIRKNNPDLNLPEVMPVDNRPETRAMHDAAHGRFKAANASALQAAGFQPTPENLYLAHRFGAGGATTMLRADPNARLADVLPLDWQHQNPDMRGQTVASFQRLASERMKGVGMPYQAGGESTQYALQPSSLPRYVGPGMDDAYQAGGVASPQFTARAVPTNYQPGPQVTQAPNIPQGDYVPGQGPPPVPPPAPVPPPVAAPPSAPPQVPKPMLSAQEYATIRAIAQTPKEAEDLKTKAINEKWTRAQTAATEEWRIAHENYRFNRGQEAEQDRFKRGLETEGDWIRGDDGVERFVPKSQRKAGMARTDKPEKPPEPGTEAGDAYVLTRGDPTTRDYLAAYNREKARFISGADGAKYLRNMSAYDAPTFVAPNASRPADVGPAGLTPVPGEKKYTEAQGKDHTYAARLDNSIPQLEAMLRGDDGKYSTARLPSTTERMKMDSSFYPDARLSPETKEFRRLAKDIVSAILRRESGASIPINEYGPEYQKYIPLPGDSHEEIAKKLQALKISARSIADGSGRPLTTYKSLNGGDPNGGGSGESPAPSGNPPAKAVIKIDQSGRRK